MILMLLSTRHVPQPCGRYRHILKLGGEVYVARSVLELGGGLRINTSYVLKLSGGLCIALGFLHDNPDMCADKEVGDFECVFVCVHVRTCICV